MAQDEISKKVELNWLSAFYGGLLTDKQRQVLTLHCEEDLSLTEIAQEVGISRQGVHDTLARAEELLEGYERTLGCIARDARLQKQLEVIAQNAQALARIPAAAPQAGAILRAVREIKE